MDYVFYRGTAPVKCELVTLIAPENHQMEHATRPLHPRLIAVIRSKVVTVTVRKTDGLKKS